MIISITNNNIWKFSDVNFELIFKIDDIKKHQPPLQNLKKLIDKKIFHLILESE